jgi:glycosyltransferase involved in cell wall biosynthesis
MNKEQLPRVCMLQPYLTPYRLGLFNELNRQLNDGLTILYFSREEKARKWTFERNVEFREVQLKTRVKATGYNSTRVHLSTMGLAKTLIRLRPDVLICAPKPVSHIVRLLQPFLGFKLMVWAETNELTIGTARPKKWPMHWIDRGVRAYIVPGRMSERYLRNIRGYKRKVWFAPNTIDRNRFACLPRDIAEKFSADECRFLFSGSLIPLKGIDALQEAFERLAKTEGLPSYRLDIIGDGPLDKKPVPNVHYHGYLSQDECAAFMKQAHVLVLTSLWDCNPLVVTEAVTAGCATVLSDGVGNYPEYTDGNGFVFARGNADALYEILVKMLRMDRDELKQMAMRSLEIAADVSHENSARVFVQAIRECCAK